MAVGSVGAPINGTAGTSTGVAATATVTADVGDTLILVAGSDDEASAEALPANAVTDSAGNTWTRIMSEQNTDNGSQDEQAAAVYGTVVTNALASGTVTLTPVSTVPVKDFTLYRFTGLSLAIRGLNSGQGSGTGGQQISSLATSAPLSGDLVIAFTVMEGPTSDTWTPDSDTTNGTWSSNATDGTTGGTDVDNITIRSQFKIVNAAGTQTYDGSNSTQRSWCRGIVALIPSPAPPAAALPPTYVPKHGRTTSTGLGRITAGVMDTYSIGENFDPRLPPVVFSVGAGSTSDELAGSSLPSMHPLVQAITDMGFVVVTPTTILTYGNSTAMTRMGQAITFARTEFGCSTKPVVLVGASEGATDSMTYAYNNPTLVACVVSVIPIIDLTEMVEQNTLGLAQSVLDAWGVSVLPLPAGADPMLHQTDLIQIPMQHWYSTDDAVSANITAFQNGTGCDIRAVGPLGHTDAAIAAAWPTDIARFIRKRVGVPYHSRDVW